MDDTLTPETTGGVESVPSVTVRSTGTLVVRFPAVSRATAVSVCQPFVTGAVTAVVTAPDVIAFAAVVPLALWVDVASSGLAVATPAYS